MCDQTHYVITALFTRHHDSGGLDVTVTGSGPDLQSRWLSSGTLSGPAHQSGVVAALLEGLAELEAEVLFPTH